MAPKPKPRGLRPGMQAGGSVNVARDDKAQERAARARIAAIVGERRPAAAPARPAAARPAPAQRSSSSRSGRGTPLTSARPRGASAAGGSSSSEWDSLGPGGGGGGGGGGGRRRLSGASGSVYAGRRASDDRIREMLERTRRGGRLTAQEQRELAARIRAEYAGQQSGRVDLERVERLPGLNILMTPGGAGVSPLAAVGAARSGDASGSLGEGLAPGGQAKKKKKKK